MTGADTPKPCALDLCPYASLSYYDLCFGCRFMLPDKMQHNLNRAWRYRVEYDAFPPYYAEALEQALQYLKAEDFYKRLQAEANRGNND